MTLLWSDRFETDEKEALRDENNFTDFSRDYFQTSIHYNYSRSFPRFFAIDRVTNLRDSELEVTNANLRNLLGYFAERSCC